MENRSWLWKIPLELRYFLRRTRTIYWLIFHWIERHTFRTYLIYDCARCEDCGRNVHDFIVPDDLWREVYGSEAGILCYDCFCDRADRKFHYKWRMELSDHFKWIAIKGE